MPHRFDRVRVVWWDRLRNKSSER